MRDILKVFFKNKYLEIAAFFTLISFLNIGNFLNSCKNYVNLGFDNQNILAWDYASSMGVVPYKDIFYPYGILTYLKNYNVFFHIIFFLFASLLFTLIFLTFLKLTKDKIYAYIFSLASFLFVQRFIRYEEFNRYGIILLFSYLVGFLLYSRKLLSKKIIYEISVLVGIIFSLFQDQGVYAFILFLFYLIFYLFVQRKHFTDQLVVLGIFISGIITGLIPFIIYLINKSAIWDFLNFFLRLSDITLYAKTPFIPYSKSPENIFTLSILIFTIFYLCFVFVFERKKASLSNYIQVSLVAVLILLEQKSLMRSIDRTLTLFGFQLFIVLFWDFIRKVKKYKVEKLSLIFYFLIILVSILYLMNIHPYKVDSFSGSHYGKSCVYKNINYLISKDQDYFLVKNKIIKDLNYNGKIFSFPADPVFYMLFNQTPPFYSNNYDSSSSLAQNTQINYIKNNNVKYILYNLEAFSLQDGVPNYIRTPEEIRFIFNNFKPVEKIGKFLLLEKNDTDFDLLDNQIINNTPTFLKYIQDIDLQKVPISEGKYKSKFINKTDILSSGSVDYVNKYFQENTIYSSNKLLVLIPEKYISNGKDITITIKTSDLKYTNIKLNKCKTKSPCIINLSNIPLFYKQRIIRELTFSDFDGKIEFINNYDKKIFW